MKNSTIQYKDQYADIQPLTGPRDMGLTDAVSRRVNPSSLHTRYSVLTTDPSRLNSRVLQIVSTVMEY